MCMKKVAFVGGMHMMGREILSYNKNKSTFHFQFSSFDLLGDTFWRGEIVVIIITMYTKKKCVG